MIGSVSAPNTQRPAMFGRTCHQPPCKNKYVNNVTHPGTTCRCPMLVRAERCHTPAGTTRTACPHRPLSARLCARDTPRVKRHKANVPTGGRSEKPVGLTDAESGGAVARRTAHSWL